MLSNQSQTLDYFLKDNLFLFHTRITTTINCWRDQNTLVGDLFGILSLRDKLHRLILEPTLDKVFSFFASGMLGTSTIAFFFTYSDPFNIRFIQENLSVEAFLVVNMPILLSFLLAVAAGLISLFYRRKNEPVLKQADERRKSNKEWDYLLGNRHLKEADIRLDKVDEWRKEMDYIRSVLVSVVKYNIEKDSLTNNERKKLENPEDLPVLPDFPDLSDEIAKATPPVITENGEIVISSKKEPEEPKSITQELKDLEKNDLKDLANLEL